MDNELKHRIAFLILASVMLYSLFIYNFRYSVLSHPFSAAIVSISFFSIIAIILVSLYPELLDPQRKLSKIDDYIVFISTITFLAISLSLITSFGTDDMEYIYEALNNLFSGKDPYTAFYYVNGVQPTFQINGKIVTNYIYPPASFLIYAPFYAVMRLFSAPGYLINTVNVIFDIILVILIYLEGRKKLDPFAVLPVIFLYILTTVAITPFYGVVIPATFLLISYLNDNKFGGISLGIAISFTQLSWLALPFIIIYKIKGKGLKNLGNYFIYFIYTILLINLPFLIWNYKAFFDNVITTDINTIPLGQIGLTVLNYSGIFQLEPWFFTFSEIILATFLIYVYYRLFDIIKESLWLYPMIISWFLWRTLTEYFFIWIPLLFASLYRIEYKPAKLNINIKKSIGIPLLLIVVALISVGAYAHQVYITSNPLKIVYVKPLGKLPYSSLLIEVENIGKKPINITLVRVSLPNNLNMVWNFTYTKVLPNSTSVLFAYAPYYNETINSTTFTVEVYSYYYFATYKVNTSNIT